MCRENDVPFVPKGEKSSGLSRTAKCCCTSVSKTVSIRITCKGWLTFPLFSSTSVCWTLVTTSPVFSCLFSAAHFVGASDKSRDDVLVLDIKVSHQFWQHISSQCSIRCDFRIPWCITFQKTYMLLFWQSEWFLIYDPSNENWRKCVYCRKSVGL